MLWGTWRGYLKANPDLAERLTTTKERAAHRLWCVRALRSRNQHGSLPDANVRKKLTRDSGYGKGGAVWNDQRRRRRGLQGRPQKAAVVRGLLFEWFSVLRNSVAVRIPPKLVMVKAAQLVQDYVKECLWADPPKIISHWMRGWMRQYRVGLRRPNRKYKVARHVLEERLAVFWAYLRGRSAARRWMPTAGAEWEPLFECDSWAQRWLLLRLYLGGTPGTAAGRRREATGGTAITIPDVLSLWWFWACGG